MSSQNTPKLFTPLKLGRNGITLSHRIMLAPLTRLRTPSSIPNDLMREYYEQRASEGGLLIAECSAIGGMGGTIPNGPGIFTQEQVEGWKKTTEAVHRKAGYIFLQIWHQGRVAHSSQLPGGRLPYGPSKTQFAGKSMTAPGFPDLEEPHEMTKDEIKETVDSFTAAAKAAIEAGFDGVELHGAHGYLLEQFLHDNVNIRNDEYGGSIENRVRFPLEVVDSIAAAIGPEKVGFRVSPFMTGNGVEDSDPVGHWTYFLEQLEPRGLAYVHVVEPRAEFPFTTVDRTRLEKAALARGVPKDQLKEEISLKPFQRALKETPLLSAGQFNETNAFAPVENGDIDAAVYGRFFVSNPDLPERVRLGKPFARYDRSTFYTPGPVGYTDYPTWEEQEKGMAAPVLN